MRLSTKLFIATTCLWLTLAYAIYDGKFISFQLSIIDREQVIQIAAKNEAVESFLAYDDEKRMQEARAIISGAQ